MKNNNKSKFVGVIIYAVMVVISLCIRTNPNNDLTVAGLRSMLIFIGCIAMLITRAIPMMFNCLLTLMVMAFFGCFGTGGVSSAWNSASMSTLISILCICCITSGLSHTTVPQRLGALAIRVSKGKTKLLILFLLEACAIVSTVMNDIAAIGCFTGIILGVIVAQGGPNNDRSKNKNLAKCLMIGLPIAGGLGGAASPQVAELT